MTPPPPPPPPPPAIFSGEQQKRLMPLLLALVMGSLAVIVLSQYLGKERQQIAEERRKLEAQAKAVVDVVVAAQELPEGVALELGHLGLIKMPEIFLQPNAVRDPQQAVGLVTLAPIGMREQVLANKLRRPDQIVASTLSGITPKGKRAVTIGVDALSGVGGFVRPGDTVDVLWSIPLPPERGGATTVPLFQNVAVLAVGNQMVGRSTSDQEPSQNYTVTLALSPEETALLSFIKQRGGIQLALRARADQQEETPPLPPLNEAAIMQALMPPMSDEASDQPPTPMRTVEVYRGLDRSVVSVNE